MIQGITPQSGIKSRVCYTVVNFSLSHLFWDMFLPSVSKLPLFFSQNCTFYQFIHICFLLWIKYGLGDLQIITFFLFFFMFDFLQRPLFCWHSGYGYTVPWKSIKDAHRWVLFSIKKKKSWPNFSLLCLRIKTTESFFTPSECSADGM